MTKATITIEIACPDDESPRRLRVVATHSENSEGRIVCEGSYPRFSDAIEAAAEGILKMHGEITRRQFEKVQL